MGNRRRFPEHGGDVILDFGFWSRAERADFARRAQALGAQCRIHYEDIALDEFERRVSSRNADAAGGHFVIPLDHLRQWARLFEPPDTDELSGRFNA